MNLGEMLRAYAPHIYQAHLEWAGEDLYGRSHAEIAGIHWLAAKMAEPTARDCIVCGYPCAFPVATAPADASDHIHREYLSAFTDILSPAEQAAAGHMNICGFGHQWWSDDPYNCPHCRPKAAMESTPHGGTIHAEPAKAICSTHKWMRTIFGYDICSVCGASGLSGVKSNSYTQVNTPEYTEDQLKKGKALGKAIGWLG